MLKLDPSVKLFLFVEPCDMRRQLDSLMAQVGRILERPASVGHLYVFLNRRRNYIRLLFLDSTGVCLFSKRLYKGTVGSSWTIGLALDQPALEVPLHVLGSILSGSR